MDPPILALWQSWLLLNSRSGKEDEQVMEPDTQGRIHQIEELESDVAEILILLEC